MNRLNRIILSGVTVFLWMLLMGANGRPSTPAQAASSVVIYLDDLPGNNGSTSCPATHIQTIEQAANAIGMQVANITINICPGTYPLQGAGVTLTGLRNLKIIGKGNPVIRPAGVLTAPAFNIVSGESVTIQGLTIDGQGMMGTNFTAAIRYEDTSGTISGNTIIAWHRPYSGTVPYDIGASNAPLHSIAIDGLGFSNKKVVISSNTIYDSQDTGILVAHMPAPVKITNNRVVFSSGIVPALAPAGNVRMQAGIALVNSGPGSTISGNEVSSDSDLYPRAAPYARGIMVYGTSGAKITNNTVRGTAMQISIENWCNFPGVTADNNIISGNKLYDSWYTGIRVTAGNTTVTPVFDCQAIPHANGVQISKNTIYNTAFGGPVPHYGVYLETFGGEIANASVKGNTFAGFSNLQMVVINNPGSTPGAVIGPNKSFPVPPAGASK